MAKKEKAVLDPSKWSVIIGCDEPGYEIAKGIKEHGRICKRLSSCTCNRPEQGDKRDDCFDWVKV
ncbi:hypothetical protein D3C76_407010 [compost metagenome]